MTATEPTPTPLDAIMVAEDRVLAAAVTWWGDQIVSDDMPEGHERNLAEAVDALLAAHALGRLGYGMEKGRGYTDVACARWQAATGLVPVLDNDTTHITCPNCRSCEDVHDDSDGDELVAAHCDRCGWDTRAEPDERWAP